MCHKIVYIELMAVFIPVIVDAPRLPDDDIPDNTVDFGERKSLVIGDLAAVPFKNKSCSEAFLFKRILVLADLGDQPEQIVVLSIKNVLQCKI